MSIPDILWCPNENGQFEPHQDLYPFGEVLLPDGTSTTKFKCYTCGRIYICTKKLPTGEHTINNKKIFNFQELLSNDFQNTNHIKHGKDYYPKPPKKEIIDRTPFRCFEFRKNIPIDEDVAVKKFILYVYDSLLNVSCVKEKHKRQEVRIQARDLNNSIIPINAFYCSECKKFYTNREAVDGLKKKHQFPLLRIRTAYNLNIERREESDLKLYGYTARDGVLSKAERQKLLVTLITANLLPKDKIIGTIQSLISINGKKKSNENALIIWKEDLDFVSHIYIDSTQFINIPDVHIYYSGKYL